MGESHQLDFGHRDAATMRGVSLKAELPTNNMDGYVIVQTYGSRTGQLKYSQDL